jgi:TolB-like protein/DNA-binding winged helix-turn-helix (wHTH) protein/Tfp pilus assembly protein PilF
MESSPVQRVVRFGVFEVDLRSRELRKHGLRIKLQIQPFRVLQLLLENPGELVTREEFQRQIWPANTFVDFELGLNTAIKRLRQALGDSAENPHFVETLPRLGYRFIFPVSNISQPLVDPTEVQKSGGVTRQRIESDEIASISKPLAAPIQVRHRSRWIALLSILLIASISVGGYFTVRHSRTISTGLDIHSIAVLPLENLSADPEQEYFADGMTDELITDLAKLDAVRVISRSSVMQYKRAHKTVAEIGRELKVDAVVEGTVARSGNDVRITAQLIHTASDQHLWAEEFHGEMRDALILQSRVAQAIAAQIRAKLTGNQMLIANPSSIDSQAVEYYLRGRYSLSEGSPKQGYDSAIRYFEMAIEKEPNYAAPYAGLALCYALGSFRGMELPTREAWVKGAAAAKKALQLDDQLAEAHIAMANIHFRFDWDWPEAEREFRRGLELSPNDAFGHDTYSSFLGIMGRFDEAMAEAVRARELDPLSPSVSMGMGWIYSWSRRQDEAIAEFRRTLQLDLNFSAAHSALVWCYEEKGMYAEAVSEELKAETLTGQSSEQIESLRRAFAASSIRGFWEKRLEKEKSQLDHPHYFIIARLCVRLGRTDEALDWLEKAYGARYPNMPNIKYAALWLDPVRSNPRYTDLLRRVGLPR